MLPALILSLTALVLAVLRLWAYRRQLDGMARVLEETPAQSNLRLTVGMSGAPARPLSSPLPPECRETAALPPLWEALGRVYRNLIANALRHGGGGLTVSARDGEVCFSNPLGPGPRSDPEHLFDRFYQSRPARGKGGAGLGLAIVRELMERMGGGASAQIAENELRIKLTFSPPPGGSPV